MNMQSLSVKNMLESIVVKEKDVQFFIDEKNKAKSDKSIITKDLLLYIANNYAQEVIENFEMPISNIKFVQIQNGDYSTCVNLQKKDFVLQLNHLLKDERVEENIKYFVKKINGKVKISYKPFSKSYSTEIDGKTYSVLTKNIIDFITKPVTYLENKNKETICGIKREEFFFIVKDFIKKNHIKERFLFGKKQEYIIDEIQSEQFVSTEHFNKFLSIYDINARDVFLNAEFQNQILSAVPKEYTLSEKALFVYILLCKTLSYDEEFYANNQRGMIAREHEQITRLSKINAKNNRIVCYEFTQIYAKFLELLGINYNIERSVNYATAHNSISFRVGEYLFNADSTTSVVGGDLFNAKFNLKLEGFKCTNKNIKLQKNYTKTYNKVYDDVSMLTNSKNEDTFEQLLNMLDALTEKQNVTQEEKFEMLKTNYRNLDCNVMEKNAYLIKFSKCLFEQEAKNNQFAVTMVAKKSFSGFNIKTLPVIIFSFNKYGFDKNPDATEYIMLDENEQFLQVYKQILLQSFEVGTFKHITAGVQKKHFIPGIDEEMTK